MRAADLASINLAVPESEPGGYGKRNMSVMPRRQRAGDGAPSNLVGAGSVRRSRMRVRPEILRRKTLSRPPPARPVISHGSDWPATSSFPKKVGIDVRGRLV